MVQKFWDLYQKIKLFSYWKFKPTKKIEKAKELKINIMTEENWYKLLNR